MISNHWDVTKPYQAPAGATAVVVGMRLNTIAANNLPQIHIDDVEFVGVPADLASTP